MAQRPIQVKIRDTEHVLFEGESDRISSFNEVGPFDVLPMHANFISILHKNITVFNHGQKVKEFPIEQAVMKVKDDQIHIYLGIEAFTLDEIEGKTKKQAPPASPAAAK